MWSRTKRIEIYQDKKGEWRWRMVSSNGRIMADGAEGYSRRINAVRGAERFRKAAAKATINYEMGVTNGPGN